MELWMRLFLLFFLFHISSTHSLCNPYDSFLLQEFGNSLTIDKPTIYNDSYYPKTTTWKNESDCCSWVGVTCHPISGHVIGLDLSCSGLYGKIHPNSTLFHLSHLQSLNLAFNDFDESHFSFHFGGFASLTYLNLSASYFQGQIPLQISHLSKLASLDLSDNPYLRWKEDSWKRLLQNATHLTELVLDYTDMSSISIKILNLSSSLLTLSLHNTQLTKNLTGGIFCLPNLQYLYLSYNFYHQSQLPNICSTTSLNILDLSFSHFQGSIPPSFSNLSHLTSLDLSFNSLVDSIPSSLLTLPRLSFLSLYDSHLSGEIPNVFPQANKFKELHFKGNNLGGELPSTLSNLQHLTLLDLSGNKLSGQIPDVFVGLTKLTSLDLSNNNFEGKIPSSLFGLTQLSELKFSYNNLEGPLPNKISGFSSLVSLSFDNNLLNGSIPSWCLSLPSLVNLDLSENKFTGLISANLSYSLNYLFLSYNNLQGNIPETIFNLVNLTELDLSSNNLSGHVHFPLFSKLPNLEHLLLSHNDQLSLNFESNVNYTLSWLITLDLSSVSLIEFPNLAGKVPALLYLYLSNNKIDGRVPHWLPKITSLYLLDLSHNQLEQSLDQFSWNQQLQYLDFSFNKISGVISSSICNASSIQYINLSHNMLTGTIPQCLANSSSYLKVLDLQQNKLHGTLPSRFPDNCRLNILNLNDNQLKGSLPESLCNCITLEALDLANNELEDTFPHWLTGLQDLRLLVLRGNNFHGPIENLKTKHGFVSLVILDISSNNFSGPIPKVYIKKFEAMKNVFQGDNEEYIGTYDGYFPKVKTDYLTTTTKSIVVTMEKIRRDFVSIDLSKNRFVGEIPDVIGKLRALRALNLSHNMLSSPIPQSMGNLTNLESLDLSSNMLTGMIPTELTNLNFLEVLNLSNNHIVGEIPEGKQFNTFSNDSYEGNSGLCGLPLTKKCRKEPEEHSPTSLPFKREDGFGFGWKAVALGYGCGMVFGMGMGCCVFLIGKPQWLVRMVA
ncbi:receptor-like protein 9DC3 [Vigna unguiculata]|uniref:receptor-like protein 9DC3 n=1 Tax=Vigna unguiculata TaxID=3917 RepID=UPI001016624F|nr:receptor-like protein 9DC3 [Vigna unguiculata]